MKACMTGYKREFASACVAGRSRWTGTSCLVFWKSHCATLHHVIGSCKEPLASHMWPGSSLYTIVTILIWLIQNAIKFTYLLDLTPLLRHWGFYVENNALRCCQETGNSVQEAMEEEHREDSGRGENISSLGKSTTSFLKENKPRFSYSLWAKLREITGRVEKFSSLALKSLIYLICLILKPRCI